MIINRKCDAFLKQLQQLEIPKIFMKSLRLAVFALISVTLLSFASCSIFPEDGVSCCDDNSVSVVGQGKVSVQPDIAIVNIGTSVDAKTSQQAVKGVADKINQIKNILNLNKISKNDIETQSLNINPRYDYTDGKTVLVGQTAQQTLSVTVRNINQTGGILGSLIDQLVAVDGIQFNGLTFDKEDKSQAQKQARKLAFNDAKLKAGDLAGFAERKLGKTLTIVDSTSTPSSPIFANAQAFTAKTVSTSVSVGSLDVYYQVSVKFALL